MAGGSGRHSDNHLLPDLPQFAEAALDCLPALVLSSHRSFKTVNANGNSGNGKENHGNSGKGKWTEVPATKEEYVGPARSFHWQACAHILRESRKPRGWGIQRNEQGRRRSRGGGGAGEAAEADLEGAELV